MSDSVERNSAMASIKLDLPEPFAPIKIFSGKRGISGVFSPKERRLTACRECNNKEKLDDTAFTDIATALFVLICLS